MFLTAVPPIPRRILPNRTACASVFCSAHSLRRSFLYRSSNPCYTGHAVCSVRSLLLSACALTTVASAQRGDDLLPRVGSFVRAASDQLDGVIADETYRQELYAQPFEGGTRPRIRQRSMRSEALFLFLRLRAGDEWMFVRNVVAVDGTLSLIHISEPTRQ